jgi:ankyrin repeat protein
VNAFAPDGFTPVALAAFFRHPEVVKLLVDAGADLNLRSKNAQKVGPLHAAAARNDVQTLELLLLRGADPNLPQEKLARPLHSAAANGSTVAVALLLMYGADPNAATEEGERPADMARKKGHALATRLEAIAAAQRAASGK